MTELFKQQQLFNLLKDDEILFQEFLNNSKDSIILLDHLGYISEWNIATEKITGLSREDTIHVDFLNVLPSIIPRLQNSKELLNSIKTILLDHISRKGNLFNKSINIRIKNSTGKETHLSTLLIFYKNKEKYGLGIISEDITKQLEMSKKAKLNEKYLHIIFDNDAIGVVFYKPKSGFINVNQRFIDITGYSLDELKKITIDELTHPDDLEAERELYEETYQKKGKKYSIEKRLIRKNQQEVWVKLNTTFQWSTHHELEMVFGFVEDITLRKKAEEALKESERKYRFIAEKASDIIYSVSLDSKLTFYNNVIERVFDISKEEIEQHKYDHLMLPKDKEFAKKLHEERLSGKKPPLFVQGFKNPKGKTVYLEISVNPLFDEKENVAGSLGIARDVTDRVFAEQQLNEKNIELENLLKTKDKFLSIIAHDLRDPFNILLGFSDLLLDNYDSLADTKKKSYIESINTSANIGYNLLKNLLDWTRSQTGKLNYVPQEITFNILVKNVIYSLKNSTLLKNINIYLKTSKEINIVSDENMIKTVLRNLLTNAIKFSYPDGEIFVEIVENNSEVIISIEDHGIGINKNDLEKLFISDITLVHKGTLNEKGTGLGLAICKEFVTAWGGKIWVKSKFGEGSTFSFSIPNK